jgi:3'(2'), 5'-bisphosphate nucleotidase
MTTLDISILNNIAIKAGEVIMNIYSNPDYLNLVEHKSDNSPLTIADKQANEVICEGLSKLTPNIPIISEEGKNIPYLDRKDWNPFWLVDPLDGTKEFIKRNGEFTVNIALIENGEPTIGVIYWPVEKTLYYSDGFKSFKVSNNVAEEINVVPKTTDLTAVASRSHLSEEDKAILNKYSCSNFKSIGSSLKFCLVASGEAQIYARTGPTMEWDTAAGHAIVKSAGGTFTKLNGDKFEYNKESLLNPGFICKF